MSEEDAAIEAALAALETALGGFGPPCPQGAQTLDEIVVASVPRPVAPAVTTADIDLALEDPIELLRARLGEL